MAMSDLEIFKRLKDLSEQETSVFNSLIAQEELKVATGEEIRPLVGLLQMMKLIDIQLKKNALSEQLKDKVQSSAKQPDPQVNIHSFIITPDRR